ncbi:hypothetical protein [Rhodococcus qingshengii]|uniref:hypothetical protein n=1 Tax=Rhodococcus qingshengii TaxID=334542 RepID=UPI001A516AF3|nr:hypothetical protein [Rhodococcus qingshengii]ULD38886.1 hypothetical protein JKI97_00870 [Rhodococcus qingshengii]
MSLLLTNDSTSAIQCRVPKWSCVWSRCSARSTTAPALTLAALDGRSVLPPNATPRLARTLVGLGALDQDSAGN